MVEDEKDDLPILFGPKNGKSIMRSHPELAQDPDFKNMSHEDIYFSWLMGIDGSPVDKDADIYIRLRSAASKAFKGNKEKVQQYASNDLPDEVRVAIRRFERFSTDARLMAKSMMQKAFINMEKIINVDVDKDFLFKNKDGDDEVDWSAKKQYIDIVTTASKTLPDILRQLEDGFGIVEKKTESGIKPIDKYHQKKK